MVNIGDGDLGLDQWSTRTTQKKREIAARSRDLFFWYSKYKKRGEEEKEVFFSHFWSDEYSVSFFCNQFDCFGPK